MDGSHRNVGTVLWGGLCRGTAWLYARIAHSRVGRLMTGYRRVDAALSGGRHPCRPMSPARLRLVESVEAGRLFAGGRLLFSALFHCPLSLYGLFGLFYGLFGVLFYYLMPLIEPTLTPRFGHMVLAAVLALLSVPLVPTHMSLAEALGRSRPARLIFVRLLGVPEDRLTAPCRRMPAVLPYLTVLVAFGAACATLIIHPLVIPLALVALGLCGLIFTYPEAGVVLSTVALPLVWLNRTMLLGTALLILLTWGSYGLKLLFLHRTMRFGMLDCVMLILAPMVTAAGFTGVAVDQGTVLQGLLLLICMSDYFLIVNLMTTREYIRRCLLGVGISVAAVTVVSYLRLVPPDSLEWLAGSRAGNAIIEGFRTGVDRLSGLWAEHAELFLVLVFPWLYAYVLHTKRFFRRVTGLICIGLDLWLILLSQSVSALVCVALVTVLFFLLLGYKWPAAGAVALPAVGCGLLWVTYLFPISEDVLTVLSRSRLYKSQLWDSLWRMVRDYPFGIGLGEGAFAAVYPAYAAPDLGAVSDSGSLGFEILLSYGWPGLLLMVVALFFFVQKGLTALGYTVATRDRAMILGGMTSLVGALIFGTVRSFLTAPRVFYTLVLVVALCSAYENILFDESDVLTAEAVGTPEADDRMYRRR